MKLIVAVETIDVRWFKERDLLDPERGERGGRRSQEGRPSAVRQTLVTPGGVAFTLAQGHQRNERQLLCTERSHPGSLKDPNPPARRCGAKHTASF